MGEVSAVAKNIHAHTAWQLMQKIAYGRLPDAEVMTDFGCWLWQRSGVSMNDYVKAPLSLMYEMFEDEYREYLATGRTGKW